MNSHTSERFRKLLTNLPIEIQKQAKEAFSQFQNDPNHPDYTSSGFTQNVLFMQFEFPLITAH